MLKKGIFHPQLLKILGELRHMDMLVIGDAGLPVPKGVERVDLGWREGDPKYLDVLEEIEESIVIEKAIFANEAKKISPKFHEKALNLLPDDIEIEYIDHKDLKILSEKAKAIVLTGEFTPYTNVILIAGCAY